MEADCIFCKIVARQLPAEMVAYNDDFIAIKDIAPKAPIHYLIIPKKHYKDLQEADNCCVGSGMLAMAREIGKGKEYRLIINNGYQAGQRVFHLHMHFLAGADMPEF